ncbi:MAG: Na+/H+ antiporter subunit E [Clostridia bacterium]|nr:Na+/H+ antiporter subunit E [Clostridia bacterium]
MSTSSPKFIRFTATAVFLWLMWLIFAGAVLPGASIAVLLPEVYTGAAVALVIALLATDFFFTGRVAPLLNPLRWGKALLFLLAYIWAEIQSHLQVIYLILHPRLPINPAIVCIPLEAKHEVSLTGVANGITMTPGTLTMDVDRDQRHLYVHWLNASTLVPEMAASAILGPWAKLWQKVVE